MSGKNKGLLSLSEMSIFSAATVPIDFVYEITSIPNSFKIILATAPENTLATVSRPEALPPPL